MQSAKSGGSHDSERAPVKILGAAVMLCAALAAGPASAQESGAAGAPAVGGDAPPAGAGPAQLNPGDGAAAKGQAAEMASPAGDIEHLASRHGSAGLWRRANLKTLIANATGGSGTGPVRSARRVPAPPVSAPRNAIGLAMAAALPGHGTPGRVASPAPVPVNGPARHAAAINGTAMSRPSGAIGGPAANHSGINGTLIRPRL